jgi:predicted O-methyltransferase YrrM
MSFWYKSGTIYNIQSPFVYDFLNHVMDTEKEFYIYQKLEAIRLLLLKDNRKLVNEDYGAGSKIKTHTDSVTVSEIAKKSLSGPSKCRILFNAVSYLNPETILEAGTSLGLSSAYMASARRASILITLEGNRDIAGIAGETHEYVGLTNIEILTGKFEDTLEPALKKINKIDLVYLDGHHSFGPTMQYFNAIINHAHSKTVIILDDIYWSEDMESAWNAIKMHPEVSLTIDIYNLGFVFLDTALSKEDVCFVPFLLKPWRIGLFGK